MILAPSFNEVGGLFHFLDVLKHYLPFTDEETKSVCELLAPVKTSWFDNSRFAITRQGGKKVMSISCHWAPVVSWYWGSKG